MAQSSAFPDVMSLHYSGYVVMMALIGGGLVTFWGPVRRRHRSSCWRAT
jgi:branched-chain amino acid transport system permease protein